MCIEFEGKESGPADIVIVIETGVSDVTSMEKLFHEGLNIKWLTHLC